MNSHPANSTFKTGETERPAFDWSMTAEERRAWSVAVAKWDYEHPYRERVTLAGAININRLDENDHSNRITELQQQSRDDSFDRARDGDGHR